MYQGRISLLFKDFSRKPIHSSTFQACVNTVAGLCSQVDSFEPYLVLQDSFILSGHS